MAQPPTLQSPGSTSTTPRQRARAQSLLFRIIFCRQAQSLRKPLTVALPGPSTGIANRSRLSAHLRRSARPGPGIVFPKACCGNSEGSPHTSQTGCSVDLACTSVSPANGGWLFCSACAKSAPPQDSVISGVPHIL
jgi:hypothetical protein